MSKCVVGDTLVRNQLFELVVGSASYVQNKLLSPDKARDMFLNDRLRKPYRHGNDMEWKLKVWFYLKLFEKIGKVVLGLATSHCSKIGFDKIAGTSG